MPIGCRLFVIFWASDAHFRFCVHVEPFQWMISATTPLTAVFTSSRFTFASTTMSEERQVHLIEDETNDLIISPEAKPIEDEEESTYIEDISRVSFTCDEHIFTHDFHDALDQFERSTEVSRTVATALLSKETALVNSRLLSIQRKMRYGEAHDTYDEPAAKRARVDLKQEQESLWNRALRTKRMSMLLQSFETTQQLLLDELMACADDADFTDFRA